MRDLRPIHRQEVEISSSRSKLVGAAVVIVGLGALGAYSLASDNAKTPDHQKFATAQVRTTPEYSEPMPPPVAPRPVDEKRLAPHSQNQRTQARNSLNHPRWRRKYRPARLRRNVIFSRLERKLVRAGKVLFPRTNPSNSRLHARSRSP
jgi:hypothetical protein